MAGIGPESWFLLKWLQVHTKKTINVCATESCENLAITKYTHKCFAFFSRSKPGVMDVEIGRDPVNWLSARSSQYSLERFPKEAGIFPVKLFEFKALRVQVVIYK